MSTHSEQSAEQPTTRPPKPVQNSEQTKPGEINTPPPSFVKLAMRNMVKKGGQSLTHFGLTVVGILALLVGLAYLTR
jgi:Protein of unknown function (DUF3285)